MQRRFLLICWYLYYHLQKYHRFFWGLTQTRNIYNLHKDFLSSPKMISIFSSEKFSWAFCWWYMLANSFLENDLSKFESSEQFGHLHRRFLDCKAMTWKQFFFKFFFRFGRRIFGCFSVNFHHFIVSCSFCLANVNQL